MDCDLDNMTVVDMLYKLNPEEILIQWEEVTGGPEFLQQVGELIEYLEFSRRQRRWRIYDLARQARRDVLIGMAGLAAYGLGKLA